MKTTISFLLLHNAIEYVQHAQSARNDGRLDEEVRFSIGAQLMAALTIEGIGNEVGEAVFDKWTWRRLEKVEIPLKWHFISGSKGGAPFKPSSEPLQTIQRLSSIRNRIAHPKLQELGTEFIVRSKDGVIKRKVSPDSKVEAGDFLMCGFGKLFDDGFNAPSSRELTGKAISAIKMLQNHLPITGLEWIEDINVDFSYE